MFEKRKNSDKRHGLSFGLAMLLLLGGLFVGLNLGQYAEPTAPPQGDVNLSGEWIGTITEDYGDDSRYDFRITITQSGNIISGMSYLDMVDAPEVYSESPIEGFVDGNQVFFSQVSTTVLKNTQLDNWCLADMLAEHEVLNGQETLVGGWEDAHFERTECDGISGRILLTRQPE